MQSFYSKLHVHVRCKITVTNPGWLTSLGSIQVPAHSRTGLRTRSVGYRGCWAPCRFFAQSPDPDFDYVFVLRTVVDECDNVNEATWRPAHLSEDGAGRRRDARARAIADSEGVGHCGCVGDAMYSSGMYWTLSCFFLKYPPFILGNAGPQRRKDPYTP